GLSWLLPRLIGLARANELLLSSRIFTTDEALEMGLLNGIFPAEELLSSVHDYARTLIESVSPGSLATTKRQIYTDLHRDVRSSVETAQGLLDRMTQEPDFAEAVSAWLEKRKPSWKDR
ncbi:enoyl-CoA hydratase-related protein, partial [Myxococcota bacterium]|nr:enoyl-CoA hydratase-related protein [Myxococcota bacterium]